VNNKTDKNLKTASQLFVHGSVALTAVIGLGVVVPLTFWFAWTKGKAVTQGIAETLFSFSFAWLLISILGWFRSARRLGSSSPGRFLFGPAPEDYEEMQLWKWGRQLRFAMLSVVMTMGGVALVLWISGQ